MVCSWAIVKLHHCTIKLWQRNFLIIIQVIKLAMKGAHRVDTDGESYFYEANAKCNLTVSPSACLKLEKIHLSVQSRAFPLLEDSSLNVTPSSRSSIIGTCRESGKSTFLKVTEKLFFLYRKQEIFLYFC